MSRTALILAAALMLAPALCRADAVEERARAVYADLVRAAGDDRVPPELVVQPLQDFQVALFDADKHQIIVEPKALSVCASFGAGEDDALAALLGHELGHFYLGHTWRADFGSGRTHGTLPALQAHEEAQADRQAGYYAYLAGYPLAGVMPRLLTAIYRAYGLPDRMPGYPSLTQRRRQAAHIEREFRPALWAYEAGKRLLLLGRPGDAILAFDRAAEDFPSREVLCSAATARLLDVQEGLDPQRFPWTLPLLLDPRSRAANPAMQVSSAMDAHAQEKRRAELDRAVELLRRARLRSPDYVPARIDLACADLLRGRTAEGALEARSAGKVAGDPDALAAARTVEALCLAQEGRKDEAERILKALDGALPWVAANLAALRPGAPATDAYSLVPDPDESLGGWQPGIRSSWANADWRWMRVAPPGGEALNIYYAEGAGVFALRCVRGADDNMVAVTRPSYGGQTARGIKLGSDLAAVTKAYGHPQGVWATTAGRYLLFRRIAFLMREDRVVEWMLF